MVKISVFSTVANVCVAFQSYVSTLPNGDNIPNDDAIGHPDQVGDAGENAFGKKYENYGGWTKAYCEEDSDGDGISNGAGTLVLTNFFH